MIDELSQSGDCTTCRGNEVLDDGYPCPDCQPYGEEVTVPADAYERFRDWPVDGVHRLETDVGFDPKRGWYGP